MFEINKIFFRIFLITICGTWSVVSFASSFPQVSQGNQVVANRFDPTDSGKAQLSQYMSAPLYSLCTEIYFNPTLVVSNDDFYHPDYEFGEAIDYDHLAMNLIDDVTTSTVLKKVIEAVIAEYAEGASSLIDDIDVTSVSFEDGESEWESYWSVSYEEAEGKMGDHFNSIAYATHPLNVEIDVTIFDGRIYRLFGSIDDITLRSVGTAYYYGTFDFLESGGIEWGNTKAFYDNFEFNTDSGPFGGSIKHPEIILDEISITSAYRVESDGDLSQITDLVIKAALESLEEILKEAWGGLSLRDTMSQDEFDNVRQRIIDIFGIYRGRQILLNWYYDTYGDYPSISNTDNLQTLWVRDRSAYICDEGKTSPIDKTNYTPDYPYAKEGLYFNLP